MDVFALAQQKQQRVLMVTLCLIGLLNVVVLWPSNTNNPAPPAKSPATAAPTVRRASRLVIKEWGVAVPLPDALSNLQYSLRENEVRFTLPALKDHGCTADSIGLPTGLMRSQIKIISEGGRRSLAATSFKEINDYWYSLTGSQATCFDKPLDKLPSATRKIYDNAAMAIEVALQQLQPVQ